MQGGQGGGWQSAGQRWPQGSSLSQIWWQDGVGSSQEMVYSGVRDTGEAYASSRRSRCGEAGWDTADRVRRGREGDRCGVRRPEVDRRCDRRSSWDLPPRCRGHRAPRSRRSTSGGLQRCKEDRDRNDTSPYRGVVRREDASGRADCNTQWPIPGVACVDMADIVPHDTARCRCDHMAILARRYFHRSVEEATGRTPDFPLFRSNRSTCRGPM